MNKTSKTKGNNFLLWLTFSLAAVVVVALIRVTGQQADYTSLIKEAEANLVVESDSALQSDYEKARNDQKEITQPKTEKPISQTLPAVEKPKIETPVSQADVPTIETGSNGKYSGSGEHIVQRGETLYKIASRYGTTSEAIKALNDLPDDNLQVDQKIRIPVANSATIPTPKPTSEKHIVKSGENLSAIARKYGVSVADIKQLNNLTDDNIREGQELKIPTK